MILRTFIFLFLASALTSSSMQNSYAQDNDKGFEVFKTNVHPVLTKYCARCHGDGGNDSGPAHSVLDARMSYETMRLSIPVFDEKHLKKIVAFGTRKDMAGKYDKEGNSITEKLSNALQKWWDEENNTAVLSDKKTLSSQKIQNLAQDGAFTTLKWDLGEIDPQLKGVIFTVDIQKANEFYRLKNPSFTEVKINQAIDVQGLYVVMNGVWDMTANNYASVSSIITSLDGSSVLSDSPQMLFNSKGLGMDEIAFAFGKIEPTKMPETSANQPKRSKALPVHKAFDKNKVGKAAQFIPIAASQKNPIPPFEIGSDVGGPPHGDEDKHWVTLTHAFEMQATEVTQLQWYLVMETTPSNFPSALTDQCDEGSTPDSNEHLPKMCKHHPVEKVSWNDVQTFISILNQSQGLNCGDTKTKAGFTKALNTPGCYRLPTESEWEYVAHGGLPPEYAYGFGNDFDGKYAWYSGNANQGKGAHPHAVATKLPIPSPQNENDSLYDMAGNVCEWTQDVYADYPKTDDSKNPAVDPLGLFSSDPSDSDTYLVLRGGSWANEPEALRSAQRFKTGASLSYETFGFRLVRTSQ